MFDDLTDIYDAMIDWPKRLAHEGSFYRRVFEQHDVRSVVDVACGTGRHAAMFHSWGLRVEAADLSPAMIDRARKMFGEPEGLRWIVRGFDEAIPTAEPFGAAVCIGNSLPLAGDMATVERAIQNMLGAVRSGGVMILHAINLWRLPDGPCIWQKCQKTTLPEGEGLIIKGIHRSGSRGHVEVIVVPVAGGAFATTESVPFLGLDATELESIVRRAGGHDVHLFGGYPDEPYDRQRSVDLLMVAQKS